MASVKINPNCDYRCYHDNQYPHDGDYVVLLHGIGKSSRNLRILANYLQNVGFEVINLDYPSTKHKIVDLADIVNQKILLEIKSRNDSNKNINSSGNYNSSNQSHCNNRIIHFVTHSMGGLIIRALLSKYHYPNLGRVVQLAPPNQGSEVADFFKNFWLYKKIFGKAGQELITDQSKIKENLGEVNYELGIIAGNCTVNPILSMIIPGANDGKVAVARTALENMKDHITIPTSHFFFPYKKLAQKQVVHFLLHGRFIR